MILIIGYGNTLRQDDGAGYKVAEIVAQWHLEGVRSIPCHQLTPDLAQDIAQSEKVIFIDAVAITDNQFPEVTLKPITTSTIANSLGHSYNMETILAMSLALYGTPPPTYALLIPALNFDFGEQFSLTTETSIIQALEILQSEIIK